MKLRITFLAMFLLVPQVIFCEKKEQAKATEEIVKKDSEETIRFLLAQQKKTSQQKRRETLGEFIHKKTALKQAPQLMPQLISVLIHAAQIAICYHIASYVSKTKLIDYPYLQINLRDVARIGLEGASHMAIHSLLRGGWDEDGNFKLHFSKEIAADGMNAALKHMLIYNVVGPNLLQILKQKYPDLKYVCDGFENQGLKKKHVTNVFSPELITTLFNGLVVSPTYDQVYQKLKRQAMRE